MRGVIPVLLLVPVLCLGQTTVTGQGSLSGTGKLLTYTSGALGTQPWAPILDPSRATDWTNAGVLGGIPRFAPCTQTFTFTRGQSSYQVSMNAVAPTGALQWQASHAYNVGDMVADLYGNLETVIVAGTSQPPHPMWPTMAGGTVVDGTVTWTMSVGTQTNPAPWIGAKVYANGTVITDDNGNLETATQAGNGTSRARYEPTWLTGWTGGNEQTNDYPGSTLVYQRSVGGTDSDLLNRALYACATNQPSSAVVLTAGNFILTYGLAFNPSPPQFTTVNQAAPYSNVVLRGAGPDQTRLYFWNNMPCNTGDFCITGMPGGDQFYGGPTGQGNYGGGATFLGTDGIIGAYHQGSKMLIFGPWSSCDPTIPGTTITVNCAGTQVRNPAAGDVIHVDQRGDAFLICPVSGGTGNCTGVAGVSESGNTVTVHTTLPHGFIQGQCVGTASIGANSNVGNATNVIPAYNSIAISNNGRFCSAPPNNLPNWFQITSVPDATTFTYNISATGLATDGITSTNLGQVTVDTGGLYTAQMYGAVNQWTSNTGRNCPANTSGRQPGLPCATGEWSGRPQAESKAVTATVNPGQTSSPASGSYVCPLSASICLEVDSGLFATNWRSSQNPAAWFIWSMPQYDGIEDLLIDAFNDRTAVAQLGAGSSTGVIKFTNTKNSWVKNVTINGIGRNAVWLISCHRISLVENYLNWSRGLQSTAYGFEVQGGSSGLLEMNNICQRVNGCYMNNVGSGNIMAYNFNMAAPYAANLSSIQQTLLLRPQISVNHESAWNNLVEGNVSPGVAADQVHGTGNSTVMFRNRIVSQDYPLKYIGVYGTQFGAFVRGSSFVGNVLGIPLNQPGAANFYENNTINNYYLWNLATHVAIPNITATDYVAWNSTMRWGNYDTVTAAANNNNGTRWCGDTGDPGWTTVCQGVTSATYQSGGSFPGLGNFNGCLFLFNTVDPGATPAMGFINIGWTGSATAPATAPAAGTPIQLLSKGMNWVAGTNRSITATLYSTTGCSGTANITVDVGPISEVPSTNPATFLNANPVPPSHTLPPSFFMTQRPDWWTTTWGTPGWPAIGPDVVANGPLNASCSVVQGDETGMTSPNACNGVNNMAYMIPAQICYNHLAMDPTYQQTANVTGATWSNTTPYAGGVVTLTLDRQVALAPNELIIVNGINPPAFNGTYLSLGNANVNVQGAQSSNQVWYVIPAAGSNNYRNSPGDPTNGGTTPYVSGGTMTWPNIRSYNARNCYPNATY